MARGLRDRGRERHVTRFTSSAAHVALDSYPRPVSKPVSIRPPDDGHSLSLTASPPWYTLSASFRSRQALYLLGSERVSHRKRA